MSSSEKLLFQNFSPTTTDHRYSGPLLSGGGLEEGCPPKTKILIPQTPKWQ